MTIQTDICDAKQREQALCTEQSFAVSAPAGSGKTGLLTQRVLKLLAKAKNPEDVLCLTFTRKAAGEMRQRIHSALLAAQLPEPTDSYQHLSWQLAKNALKQDAKQGWHLVQSPNRLRITTIDSFCRNLAQQLAPESGISEGLATLDNAEHFYAQAVADVLLNYLENDNNLGAAIRTLLLHQDNNLTRLNDLLISLLQQREQWLGQLLDTKDSRTRLEGYLQQIIHDVLQKLTQQLAPITGELLMLADYAGNNLLDNHDTENPLTNCAGIIELPDETAETLPEWLGLAQLLLTNAGGWRKIGGINKKIGFPTAKDDPEFGAERKAQIKTLLAWCKAQPGLLETLVDVRNLPAQSYPEEQWQVLQALTVLLPVLAAQLKILFQQHNQCDFTEITLAALQSLGSEEQPTDLALRLDYQIKHILVDEFQDTSTVQYQLLQSLTRGWQTDDGRTLFIVGDGMQSLYSFRNANVGLFLEARIHPIGAVKLVPLDLQTNFRSQQGIVQWVNEAFATSFPAQNNINRGAVCYSPAQAVKPLLNKPAVTIDGFIDFDDLQTEAAKVLEHINAAKQNDPNGSIAVLVRDRGYLKYLLPVLREAGLQWTAKDIEPLASQMQVIDLLSLTRALLNPADRIAWLSVLRAPWCGLDLKDLYHLTNSLLPEANPKPQKAKFPLILMQLSNFELIEELSISGQQILARVKPLLIECWEQRQRQSLRSSIEGLWRSLGGNQLNEYYPNGNCSDAYFNLIEQHEITGTIENWQVFSNAVNKLYAEPLANSDPNLQIMTIHKAKGLEFDTVIIPGMNRKSAPGNNPLMMWREGLSEQGQSQLIISPVESTGEDNDATYKHLKHEQKLKEQLENTRVMYVGATRAIKRLHLLYSIKNKSKPSSGSLLGSLWKYIGKLDEENSISNSNITVFLTENTNKQLEESSASIKKPLPTINKLTRLKPNTTSPEIKAKADPSEPLAASKEDTEASLTGTLLHRILRQITLDGITNWDDNTIANRSQFWKLQLIQAGSKAIEDNIQRLQTSIKELLKDTENHWIFDHTLHDSHCEYTLGYMDKLGENRTAIIDRTFIIKTPASETRWIIDYKLSERQPTENMGDFITRQKAQYQQQLTHYAKLMHAYEQLPIKTALYLPLQARLITMNDYGN